MLQAATLATLALSTTSPTVRQTPLVSSSAAAPATAVKLHFSDVGARVPTSQPPILILHGLFGAGGNFGSWATRLHEECTNSGSPRRIILADLRNHGDSEQSSSMEFADMAADVTRLLDEQGIERCVLCGHSIGGKVAMVRVYPSCLVFKGQFPLLEVCCLRRPLFLLVLATLQATALLHPERIERLLVLDMAPVAYAESEPQWDAIKSVVAAMRTVKVDLISSKRDADQMLARTVSDAGLRAFVLMNLVRKPDSSGFRWRVNLDAIEESLPSLASWDVNGLAEPSADHSLGGYNGNTLFVGGGKSRFLRSSHMAAIQERFSRFSLSTIRTADHWIHADEPEALLLIAQNFLAFSEQA